MKMSFHRKILAQKIEQGNTNDFDIEDDDKKKNKERFKKLEDEEFQEFVRKFTRGNIE